jgi:acetylornithine/succinyldiaminopimelate/putrescine aminotransferase
VEIRIGIVNAPRELGFESSQTPDEIAQQVEAAIAAGTGVLRLTDDKGRVYIVPTAGIAYVEVGAEESRRIGFVG